MAVYMYLLPSVNKVKIGFSSDVEARIRSLSTGSFEKGKLLREIVGYGKEGEAYLHKKFSHLRTFGEWFDYDESMLTIEIPTGYKGGKRKFTLDNAPPKGGLIMLPNGGMINTANLPDDEYLKALNGPRRE